MQEFVVTITPRMYEADAMGHINNEPIAPWFEVVRVGFLQTLEDAGSGIMKSWILAALHIDFKD